MRDGGDGGDDDDEDIVITVTVECVLFVFLFCASGVLGNFGVKILHFLPPGIRIRIQHNTFDDGQTKE